MTVRGLDALIDLQIALVRAGLGSLYDIDRTDVDTIFDLSRRLGEMENTSPPAPLPKGGRGGKTGKARRVYCDEVDWL